MLGKWLGVGQLRRNAKTANMMGIRKRNEQDKGQKELPFLFGCFLKTLSVL